MKRIKGKNPTVAQKKLLANANLNPNNYLYLRMANGQTGWIFVDRDTGEKTCVTDGGSSIYPYDN